MKHYRKQILPVLMFLLALLIQHERARGQTLSQTGDAANKSLSESQVKAIKSIVSTSEKKAAPLAIQLAATAKLIYENMLAPKEDQRRRLRLSKQLDRITNELLGIKGQSMRDVIAVLTPAQKQLVREEMSKPGQPADLMELIKRVFKIGK